TIGRCFIVQSPLWLMFHGRIAEAQAAAQRLLWRAPPYPKKVVLHRLQAGDRRGYPESASRSALFRGTNLPRTILASVPWFLQDLGTYGIGMFTPTILATLIGASINHPRNAAELIQHDILATRRRIHRRAVDRGNRLCRATYRPHRPHPAADSRLHRLRRGAAARGAVAPRRRDAVRRAPLRRVHGVQLYDQYRPERHDLSDRVRGFSHFDPWRGRGFRGLFRQNRRSIDRVPVPDPAQGYRH